MCANKILFCGHEFYKKIQIIIPFFKLYSTTVPVIPSVGKKKKGKMGEVMEKKILPVETDTNKLVNYVCGSNILQTGEDIGLKPDSEYPDWLWEIYTGPPKTLDELDTNSKKYWLKVRKMANVERSKILKKQPWKK